MHIRQKQEIEAQFTLKDPIFSIVSRVLESDNAIKFAYLFGSHAKVTSTPKSDIDIAVYLDNRLNLFTYRLQLMEKFALELKNKTIDLVVLNSAPILLQYQVIHDGILLKDQKKRRVLFETRVLRQYLDFEPLRYTQQAALKAYFQQEPDYGQ